MARTRFPGRDPRAWRHAADPPAWEGVVFVPDPPARPDDHHDQDVPEGETITTRDGRTLRRVVIEP